jgi:hypothetical protein
MTKIIVALRKFVNAPETNEVPTGIKSPNHFV